VGDFNGDGHPDLVTTSPNTDTVNVLLNQGDGTTSSRRITTAGANDGPGHRGRLPGCRGRDDIVAANNTITVGAPVSIDYLASNSDGSFATPQLLVRPGFGGSPQALVDVNGDGIPDHIFIAGQLSTVGKFGPRDGETFVMLALGLGDGTFGAARDLNIGPLDISLGVTDVNGDGHPDIIVDTTAQNSGFPTHPVMVALNTGDWSDLTAGATGLRISTPQQVSAGGPLSP